MSNQDLSAAAAFKMSINKIVSRGASLVQHGDEQLMTLKMCGPKRWCCCFNEAGKGAWLPSATSLTTTASSTGWRENKHVKHQQTLTGEERKRVSRIPGCTAARLLPISQHCQRRGFERWFGVKITKCLLPIQVSGVLNRKLASQPAEVRCF